MTRLVHHDVITGTHGVHKRRFPSTGAGSGVNDHWMARSEDLLDVLQHLEAERTEFGSAMVDGR